MPSKRRGISNRNEQVEICHPERSRSTCFNKATTDQEDKHRSYLLFFCEICGQIRFYRGILHYGYAFGRNDEFKGR